MNSLMEAALDVVLKLIAEAIEVTLDDQGSPWESKNKPEHKDL